ncbi:MAG: hypothetical protein IT373_30605 [Polyangiaceae bacterium]|nr:hypothetical protein [Polyangiaceae bacterium]
MPAILDTLLLLALPASGKSEVRKYLAGLSPAACRDEFGIGPTVQLDDYPYVHLMRRIDDELAAHGGERGYFLAPDKGFRDGRDWRTLIELVNEDYADLVCQRRPAPASAAEWLFDRIDLARSRVGALPHLGALPARLRGQVAAAVERDARALYDDKVAAYFDTLAGKTVVIEFARGGAAGSPLPLPEHYGYRGSVSCLSPAILDRASILYIWVTPEESRRKNDARADPNDPGSILHHGVPIDVMLGEYGCDDMAHLLETSGRPDHLRLPAWGREYELPVARFDNRVDKTSFVRAARETWASADVAALHGGLKDAFTRLRRG